MGIMNFKLWLEAQVSSEDMGDALKKTMEFSIEGDWKFQIKKEPSLRHGVKFTGELRNNKTPGNSYFFLSTYAIFFQPVFAYDSIAGGDALKITAMILFFDGKGGYVKLGERGGEFPNLKINSSYGYALKTPLELSQWTKFIVDNWNFRDDNGGDEEEPEPWTPTPSDSKLVTV